MYLNEIILTFIFLLLRKYCDRNVEQQVNFTLSDFYTKSNNNDRTALTKKGKSSILVSNPPIILFCPET